MAYLREEKEKLEVDYPLQKLWDNIPKAVKKLEWKIQKTSKDTHHLKIKTKGGFMSYPSTLKVDLEVVDEKTTRMLLAVETPVTTITSMADIGRTRDRLENFVVTLAKIMDGTIKP